LQLASRDSRMIVEYTVQNSEFCISWTTPESEAETTSARIGSAARLTLSSWGRRPCPI